jgi:hypothetical protein
MWVNWQRVNTPQQRERFDAGLAGRAGLLSWLALGFQTHIVHAGGQQFASGPVADSVAYSLGAVIERRRWSLDQVSAEVYLIAAHHTPDREDERSTVNGKAMFTRLAGEKAGWRGHLIVSRGCHFIKDEGDPNYGALREDGTRFRPVRDYAEIGLTRAHRLAPEVAVEGSVRLHRVEQDYDYSYRILAVVNLGVPLKTP